MLFMKTVTVPEGVIQHKEDNTQVFVEEKSCGTGTLYIAESCMCWISTTGEGLSFEYPMICIHAISRDTSSFPHPCIYMQVGLKLETEVSTENQGDDSDEGQGAEEDTEPCTVLRLVPQNPESLQAMFQSLSDCQTLHPDADDSDQETEFFNSAGDIGGLSSQGLITLQRLEGMLQQGRTGGIETISANGDSNGVGGEEAIEGEEEAMDEEMGEQ